MICVECFEECHEFCSNPPESGTPPCCCPPVGVGSTSLGGTKSGVRDGMQWSKEDQTIRDQKSTGRKRAAVLYPLDKEADCEWRSLSFAGGGLYPIIGCATGKQQHRHHGPILLTLANYEGNVHRICNPCHSSWHTNNDPFVKSLMRSVLWRPHDAKTMADPKDLAGSLIEGQAKWSRERYSWKAYRKETDDYKELLDELQNTGQEANTWFGY